MRYVVSIVILLALAGLLAPDRTAATIGPLRATDLPRPTLIVATPGPSPTPEPTVPADAYPPPYPGPLVAPRAPLPPRVYIPIAAR